MQTSLSIQLSVKISSVMQQNLSFKNHILISLSQNWISSVIKLIRDVMSCFIPLQFTSINMLTSADTSLSAASRMSISFIRILKQQLLNMKWDEMKDQKHVKLTEYKLDILNAALTNMLEQLKLKQKVWACLQNQIDILKHEQNEFEKKLTAEIAVLKDALKKFKDNHKIIMLK